MTNYERLLDLPLREVLKEFGNPDKCEFSHALSFLMNCNGVSAPCSVCGDVEGGSCSSVCRVWLDSEAAPDANYNDDRWRNTKHELPLSGDTTQDYIVHIKGASVPTVLAYDGEFWLDDNANSYCVDYWRPMPKLPEDLNA